MGTAFSVDGRYAKVDDIQQVQEKVKKVETRLDNKILKDRANLIQERIWKYEDRYEGRTTPDTIKDVIRDLEKELSDINKKLDKGQTND
jgi:gas vesicle protein